MTEQNIEDSYALSPMQEGMLFHSIASPQAGLYVQQMVGELREELDVSAFQLAWQRTAERHSILRTSFCLESTGQPLQAVLRHVLFPFEARDWRNLSATEQQQSLDTYLKADRQRGFELTKAPLMRLALFRMDDTNYHMVWTSHHALLDGRSRLLLLQELFACYEACSEGKSLELESPRPFRDYIDWLTSQDLSAAQSFWQSVLEGSTAPTPMGIDGFGVSETDESESAAIRTVRLSSSLTLALKMLASEHQLTPNALLQGAWALLLSHYSGKEEVLFGTTRAGRRSTIEGPEGMIGLFIHTVPLRIRVPAEMPIVPWLKELRTQWVNMRSHEYLPLSKIQECSGFRGSSSLFESLLVFENFELNSALRSQDSGFEKREFHLLGRTNYPLTITGYLDQQLLLKVEFDRRRFDESSIERLLGHFETLLTAMTDDPWRRLSDLPVLTGKERKQLLFEWNETSVPYPREQCVHGIFERQVEKSPDSIALVSEDYRLTYRELNTRANKLAHYLKRHGISSGSLVGICMERSPDLIVAMLGTLKAGGAYVPIDPDYPQERQTFILNNTRTRLLLTEEAQCQQFRQHEIEVISLDADWSVIAQESGENPGHIARADNLAYIVYTSGSTGQPKGVAIPHRGIVRLLLGVDYVQLSSDERLLHLSSISFDASTFEVWGALLHGAQLVIFPDRVPSLGGLERVLKRHEISILWLTSSLFNLVVDESPAILRGVRQLLTGGEALSVRHVVRALEALPDTRIINGYGPTENTTFTCSYSVPRDFDRRATNVPIGRPISNTQVFVLNSRLQPVPIGVIGELYIGGDGLAQGYLNQPGLTAERFLLHPFSSDPSARLYKTGDLVRYRPDGNIEFHGRVDCQVKIRGFRIELEEIESLLNQHPSVCQSVVTTNAGIDSVKTLTAHVVPRDNQSPSLNRTLRNFLANKLPEYMIPTQFAFLTTLPLTSNGKVDRDRLAALIPIGSQTGAMFVAPRNPVEEVLAGIWSRVLGREKIGIYDSFFDLGGNSLNAIRVVSQVRRSMGIDVSLRRIFDSPTIADLAEWIEQEQARRLPSVEVPPQTASRNQEIPLSFRQEYYWTQKRDYVDKGVLNISRIMKLRGNLQTVALQAAFNALIVRHEALRTSFTISSTGSPIQRINPDCAITLSHADVSDIPLPDREREARRLADEEGATPLLLAESLPLRVKLIRLSPYEHWLVLVIHHMVADGWSLSVLFRELGECYTASCRSEKPSLPLLPIQFADFALWQRHHLQGEALERLASYWKERTGNYLPETVIPLDFPRPQTPTHAAKRVTIFLSTDLQKSITDLTQGQHATEYMALLAAFKLLVHRCTGQQDIAVMASVANRAFVETADVVGWFSSIILFRSDLSGDPSFLELLNRVRDVVLEGYQHRGLSLEFLNAATGQVNSPLNLISLCRFTETPESAAEPAMADLEVEFVPREQISINCDMKVFVGHSRKGIEVRVDYSTELFLPETVQLMLYRFRDLLRQIVQNPYKRLSEFSLAPPGDIQTPVQHDDSLAHDYQSLRPEDPASINSAVIPEKGVLKHSPLSFAQKRLWFLDQLEPGSPAYNVNQLLRLTGVLNEDAFQKAMNTIVARHESLRTTFDSQDGDPHQVIAPRLDFTVTVVDLRDLPENERFLEAQRKAAKEAERPFDLGCGPLLRVTLFRLHESDHLLLLSMHHIVSDGWSMVVLQRELSTLYAALSAGECHRLPKLPIQYSDYATFQKRWLQGKNLEEQVAYWKRQLAGCTSLLKLPTDRPRPEMQTYQGGRQMGILQKTLVSSLEALSHREGCTLFMTLLAAFKVLLYRLTQQEDIVVGVPVAGRTLPETEGLIGFFVNTLALRTDLSGNPSFLFLLHLVRDTALDAYAHQDLPFERLVEELRPERSLSHTPLFQVMLNVWSLAPDQHDLPGLHLEVVGRTEAQSKFDLTLYAWEQGLEYRLSLVYNASLFQQSRMAEFLEQFSHLLEQIAQAPEKPIRSYSLVTAQFRLLLPDPTVELPGPSYDLVTNSFLAQAAHSPNQPAICQEQQIWTYQELSDSSLLLARALLGDGMQPGEVVAVTGPKSFGLVAGMMAVLIGGGVMLPLDRDLPPDRQRLLLREARAKRIFYVGTWSLEDTWILELMPMRSFCVDPSDGRVLNASQPVVSETSRFPELSPNDPAYIFFTSGTSGVPKGVLGCHKGLSHFLTWERETFEVGPNDRFAQLANLSFDVILRDTFLPLVSGATLCLPDSTDVDQALPWLEHQKITILHVVPSLAERWLASVPEKVTLRTLRRVFFAGEFLTDSLVRRWREAFPDSGEIVNFYGPTETTMVKCFYVVPSDLSAGVQPVGKPLPFTQALIMTENRQLCGLGEPGEIVLRTPFQTLGYINANEEQRKRFDCNPFRDDREDLVYFTGDQGRYLLDGSLEILGRLDDQVKIRGVRVEPAEVTAILSQHSKVKSCIVVASKDHQGGDVLVAYVVPTILQQVTAAELKSHMSRQLPSAMIPSTVVFLASLPLTPNGKVNRRALPPPELQEPRPASTFVAPRNGVEERMAEIWAQALGLERVGIHDNFFDLGGHSLLAMKLSSRMSAAIQRDITVRSLFLYPSIAALAEAVASFPMLKGGPVGPAAPIRRADRTAAAAEASSFEPSSPHLQIERRSLLSLLGTGKIAPVEAAAVSCLPALLLADSSVSKEEVLQDWYGGLPALNAITETSLGRIGIISIPRFQADIYENSGPLLDLVVEALELARQIGARVVSFTGLLPSATEYGQAVASRIAGRPDLPKITTGHATTAATVALTVRRILEESGRDLRRERVGFLGLGSIGTAALRLLLRCLPHPAEIILCDIYSKWNALESLRSKMVDQLGFRGAVRLLAASPRIPQEFYNSTLMVGATNVPEVLDFGMVKAGTLIVDDSAPHCFATELAVRRFQAQEDILFSEGGALKSPDPVTQLRQVDRRIEQKAAKYYREVLARFRPHRITGCVFSSLLSTRFEELEPTLGLVDDQAALKHYQKLTEAGFQAYDLHCDSHVLPPAGISNFRRRFGCADGEGPGSDGGINSLAARAEGRLQVNG